MASYSAVISLCSYVILLLSSRNILADDDYERVSSLNIEHSFDDGLNPVFHRRGTVTIHSITSNKAYIDHDDELSEDDIYKLKELVKNDGIYRVRVLSRPSSPPLYVQGFTKACGLYESKLSDKITIHLDQSASVMGISVTPQVPHCTGEEVPVSSLRHFNSTMEVLQTVTGPAPETQAYVQKLEQDRNEKAKGQQPDNRSFLSKYWMYIVPVVVIMMFANSMDPNAAQGGGGGGGGR